MGVFPEDEEISMSKLSRYWIAEGFLKAVSGKSLEKIAKEYLKDLIGRNLVLRNTRRKWGEKSCHIHDLLRDLCLREAEKERFYYTAADNVAISGFPPMSQARSLMMWNVGQKLSPLNMSLLRIVKTTQDKTDPVEVLSDEALFDEVLSGHADQLVNSRFLQIGLREGNVSLYLTAPTDFWYMPRIRHVEIGKLRLPDPPNDQDDIVLGNLQSLGLVEDFKCSEQVVKKIPNIKELVFYNLGEPDDEMYCFSNLDCLTKLESLDCMFIGKSVINFPHSLKRLVLRKTRWSYWRQDILDKVGVLPHLQELRLYKGNLENESSHFPCIECLHLDELEELQEIPLDFAEIPTLREIYVNECSDSAVFSAKRISEEHEDYYGEGALQVRIRLGSDNEAGLGLESLDSPNFRVKRVS
ncbi:putative late blight resistance protein homolog R1B-16 [Salvia miltiorrhiza]|uniref:putative late blight resistance protein homolog R1B-16 n=1 Tax=Salvia miltiorrhiza TaxID=226208 RepID=UPI0025AD094F|nr:putative late blight resistance protein homolog R1B-16 [Salvia miltiorrhiza]